MLKEWIESYIKSFVKSQITEANVASVIAAILARLEKEVAKTETKVDDAAWYVANRLLTDPVVIHALVELIQEGVADTPEIIDIEVSK